MRVCVLMPWGRVGSNLTMSYIRTQLKGKFANEPFNAVKGPKEQQEWLREFYVKDKEPGDRCVKLSVRSIDKDRHVQNFMNNHGVRVIRMFRNNNVKTVISQIRAEQYAEKTKEETGVAKWGVRKDDEPLGPSVIDLDVLAERIEIIEGVQNRLREFEFKQSLDVYYEDIVSDMTGVFTQISEFFGKPYNENYKPPFKKATPDDLSKAIINFEEFSKWLRDNGYEDGVITG